MNIQVDTGIAIPDYDLVNDPNRRRLMREKIAKNVKRGMTLAELRDAMASERRSIKMQFNEAVAKYWVLGQQVDFITGILEGKIPNREPRQKDLVDINGLYDLD